MLHGEWALMNIIIIRGREALRPKQAFYLYLSGKETSTVYTLHCKSAPALSRLRTNRNQRETKKIGEEWVWEARKGQKYQFVSKHSFLTSFYVHFVFKIHTIICSFCYTLKNIIFLKNICEEWKEICDRKWEEKRT